MITKQCGVDWQNLRGALTLEPEEVCVSAHDLIGTHTRTHDDGWTITGKIVNDYFYWVNEFAAAHPTFGKVWGDFEDEVHADSEEAFADFYAKHAPTAWDYQNI